MISPRHQATENHGNGAEGAETGMRVAASTIAKDTIVTGNVISTGDIRVDGTVHGEVRGLHAWIGFDAWIEGVVVADRVTVEGRMSGPIFAGHIHLGPTSSVEGDLCSDHITVDKGAILKGRVWPGQPHARADARAWKLPGASLAPSAPLLSGLKKLEPLTVEKSPPADPGEQKES